MARKPMRRGEHNQEQADAIHAQVVVGAERGNPVEPLFELEAGRARAEARHQGNRNQEPGQRRQVRPDLDEALVSRGDKQQDRQSGERRQEHDAE